jgi:hypothetical protein
MKSSRCRVFILLSVVVGFQWAAAAPLQLAVRNTGEPIRWDKAGYFFEKQNPPLVMVSVNFPLSRDRDPVNWESTTPRFPPPHIPVLLQLEFSPGAKAFNYKDLEPLSELLTAFDNISHLSLKGWERIHDFNRLSYVIKTTASLARGIRSDMRIALACPGGIDNEDLVALTRTLATNPETSPYFDSFFLEAPDNEKIRRQISLSAPHIDFWETVWCPDGHESDPGDFDPARILSCILESNPFEKSHTSLLVIPAENPAVLYPLLLRFSGYLTAGLYKDTAVITVSYPDGSSSREPFYFRTVDHTPVLFLGGRGPGREKVKIHLERALYREALVENLSRGDRAVFKIKRNSTALVLNLKGDFFAVHLIPRGTKVVDSRYRVDVTGTFRLSAEEIIARVRAWKTRQKSLVKTFTAAMTTSLRLRIGNLNETFDLTIKGPMYAERNKPYDWVWQEFFVNGARWKSKRVPRIPLLQPEKVNILPLDIHLTEEYRYSLAGETTIKGRRVYMVDFKPRKELKATSLYRGRIWIDAETFALWREHLIQLNLSGEVISNVETRHFKPVPGASQVRLPLSVIGHQVFSTAGRVTNVERQVTLSDIRINPENFYTLKEQAHQSDFQMVRDTREGLRYLIKDKKSGQRKVEWKSKKSQLFGVLGGFYDSTFSYPIPLLGVNYMNFDLGGKGGQLNVLFAGLMLTANYSDPSFLGSKIDVGANVVAVGFPFNNRVYRRGTEIESERLKYLPFRFQVNTGIPLGTYFKLASIYYVEYNGFSSAKTTAEEFTLPPGNLALGWRTRLTLNLKGYRLAFWWEIARRSRWRSWGLPGNPGYNPNHRSCMRWRVVLNKDFFLSPFRKIHLTASYYDGLRLDRFSAYKFGFFSDLNIHGYMSGVVQATRAVMLSLSYGYSVGQAFRLEAFYDSTWVTNPYNNYRNTYFSGAAITGTMNVPLLKGILRFEIGMPVVNNGIKGLVVYFVLLKMF